MKILPLDLTSSEDAIRDAVEKAESLFPGAGVDYMIHNAAFERPVRGSKFVTPLLCYLHNYTRNSVIHPFFYVDRNHRHWKQLRTL